MRAVQFTDFGDYDRLQVAELPIPDPAPGQVLVKMTAAAINPLDDLIRRGIVSTPGSKLPMILGNEGAGVIVAAETEHALGTHVMFKQAYNLPCGGTWQEYVLAPQQAVISLPDEKSDLEAAALRSAYDAAYLSLIYRGGFQSGQVILAPGVGGAVGNATIQLGYALGAARVLTTAGSTAKAQKAREFGYKDVIDLSQESLSEAVARLTNHEGVDLAIDSLGGDITGQALASLKTGGTLVLLGNSAGPRASFDIAHDFLTKNTNIVGHRTITTPPEVREQSFKAIFDLWTAGHIQPMIDRTFPLAQAAEAQRYQIEGRPFGKVLLTFVL